MSVIEQLFKDAEALAEIDGEIYKTVTAVYRSHKEKGFIPYCSQEDWPNTQVARLARLQQERNEFASEVARLEEEIKQLRANQSVVEVIEEDHELDANDQDVSSARVAVIPVSSNGINLNNLSEKDIREGRVLHCTYLLPNGITCGKGPFTKQQLHSHSTWHTRQNRTMRPAKK